MADAQGRRDQGRRWPQRFNISPDAISESAVSGAWGAAVTEQALIGTGRLPGAGGDLPERWSSGSGRWRWRRSPRWLQNLILTATVYLLIGFEVTPSTVIGFLTILGFALYDVVVVFDKVRENTRGITGNPNRTYGEAANLAVNQTLMRSINTAVVALLPVGGLLFIGAGLLGAGTLKDLGLVLFVGMLAAVYSSIFFATPVLVDLKEQEPRFKPHKQRVLRAGRAGGRRRAQDGHGRRPRPADRRPAPGRRPPGREADAGRRPTGGRRRRARRRRRRARVRARPPRKRPGAAARKPGGGGKPGGSRSVRAAAPAVSVTGTWRSPGDSGPHDRRAWSRATSSTCRTSPSTGSSSRT